MLCPQDLEAIAINLPPYTMESASRSDILVACTENYVSFVNSSGKPGKSMATMRTELMNVSVYCVALCNALRTGMNKAVETKIKKNKAKKVTNAPFEAKLPMLRVPTELESVQVAYILSLCYPFLRIPCAGESGDIDQDLLAVYQKDGPKAGLYASDNSTIDALIHQVKPGASPKEMSDIKHTLRLLVERKERCTDKDLVVVNNGIFNYKTKVLESFDPDKVFLEKCGIDYDPNATNEPIHNLEDGSDWDVESWMEEIAPSPDFVPLLWQVVGAVIRPNVSWGKAIFLYGQKGNNGKGTLCALMRNLCGEGRYVSIPIANFGKDFLLEGLIGAVANIVDENDVGTYLDKAGSFKASVTGDVIQINRKNKTAVPYIFTGLTVQCLNDMPRVQDASDSFYRRCLFVPFERSYTGKERKYIKYDYINRPEVLQYVLYKVLHMDDYYEFIEPAESSVTLNEYKVSNDPIRQWWEEVSDQFVWDLLPWEFLYECYKHWFDVNNRSGRVQSKRAFMEKMRKIAEDDKTWEYPGRGPDGRDKQISAAGRIMVSEPLAWNYYLPNTDMRSDERWKHRLGRSENWQGNQRGLLRRQSRYAQYMAPNTAPGNVPGPAPDSNIGPAPGSNPAPASDGIIGPAPGSPVIAPNGIPA